MGRLLPFCMASDGNSIYAASFAYQGVDHSDPNVDLAKGLQPMVVITRSQMLVSSADIQSMIWTVMGSFTATWARIDHKAYEYAFACSAKRVNENSGSKYGVPFGLHIKPVSKKVPSKEADPFNQLPNVTMPLTEQDDQGSWVVYSGVGGDDGGSFDVWDSEEVLVGGSNSTEEWIPNPSSSVIHPAMLDPTTVEGRTGGGWVRAFVGKGDGQQMNVVHFAVNNAKGDSFPRKPQHSWTMAQNTTAALAMDYTAVYALGSPLSSSASPYCLNLNVLPQISQEGSLVFATAPLPSAVKSLCIPNVDYKNNATYTMSASEGNLFGTAVNAHEDIYTVSGKVFYYGNNKTPATATTRTWDMKPYTFQQTPNPNFQAFKPFVMPLAPAMASAYNPTAPAGASGATQIFLGGMAGEDLVRVQVSADGTTVQFSPLEMSVQEFNFEPFDTAVSPAAKEGVQGMSLWIKILLSTLAGILIIGFLYYLLFSRRRRALRNVHKNLTVTEEDGDLEGANRQREEEELPMYDLATVRPSTPPPAGAR